MAGLTMAGVSDMLVGKMQELKGKVTGSRAQVLKGKARQAKGYSQYKLKRAVDR